MGSSTSSMHVLEAAQQLQAQGRACALVTVLRVQPPASARPGDKAVATADALVAGWIGGGCAQPAVLRTVGQALADGRARLIRIAPTDEGSVRQLDDVLEFGMACHSGGTLELFIDPLLPCPQLVVVGDTPVAQALCGLAPRVGFAVTVVAQGGDAARYPDAARVITDDEPATLAAQVPPGAFVVVATQGRRDVQGLRASLALQARQVSFVASARKAAVLRASLIAAGASAPAVEAIVAPAGLSMGAQTPDEIALSVLAAVVAARRAGTPAESAESGEGVPAVADAALEPTEAPRAAASTGAGSCCGGGQAEPVSQPLPPVAPGSCCGGGR